MVTLISIISISLIFVIGTAAIIVNAVSNNKESVKKKHIIRRGTYQESLGREGKKYIDVLFVLEEIEVVGEFSKVKILHIEGLNVAMSDRDKSEAERWIGNFVQTNLVKWNKVKCEEGVSDIVNKKLSETEEIIDTPLDKLVEKVLQDDIESI